MLTNSEQARRSKLAQSKPRVYEKVIHYTDKLARGESVAVLDLQYNFLCNFHCIHCAVSGRTDPRPQITPIDVADMCDQGDALGLAHFVLTGGETLVFPDFDDVILAVGPERYYIQIDTNAYLLTEKKAKYLKELGIDKVQISLDGSNADEHDSFRRKPGSFDRVIKAARFVLDNDMVLQWGGVVTHQTVNTPEFVEYLAFANSLGGAVSLSFPILRGEWAGRTDLTLTDEDVHRLRELKKYYRVNTHLDGGFGIPGACLSVRRFVAISPWGDVFPCTGIDEPLGNIREDSLADILRTGMQRYPVCNRCRIGMK